MLALVALVWAASVAIAAGSGALARLWMPAIAGLVALGIMLPTLWYFAVPASRAWADNVGLRTITAFHAWRVPAALMFFWYGAHGQLPTLFWLLAGTGDLISGLWAILVVSKRKASLAEFARMHRFGFAVFVIAVGTGLAFTLMLDPRMAPIASLPLALIPLFGVGISGASHIVAFDMLWRQGGQGAPTRA
ncbi:MAG: permease [Fulvimarina sp.]|nr:permease [Fulvimarina sp.]